VGLRLIPKEEKFFELFSLQADNVLEGAQQLKDLLEDYIEVDQKRLLIERTESRGDEIGHKILEKLNTTFITPMDREDIHALSSALDDILDLIHATATRLNLYHVAPIRPEAMQLANIILRAAEETAALVHDLDKMKTPKSMKERWIEVNRLENEGDAVSRAAIAALFEKETNPIEVIKWKDIYGHLETAIDKCEDAVNIVEAVCLKNA
jgi:predicted phosphate transport protein (TIGR00153 family)